jgi:hypothetical protein
MEGHMPSPGSSPEAAAIEAAYGAQIQLLFSKLVTNIVDEPTTHDTDQQSLDRFTKGLAIARRARQLALSAVGATPRVATPSASRRKKVKET